jgi:ADP-heptose:LPS heptosyltransferase
MWDGNPIIATPENVAAGEDVQLVKNGPHCRPYIIYPFTKESGWTFNRAFKAREHIARIYLTPEEKQRGVAARKRYGPYVLIEPYTKHENFRWPLDRWTELVAACPEYRFVQHIHQDSELIPGAHYERATFREACGLIAACEVYVRSESGLCHAAAAFCTKQVTLFGGCMDPEVMGFYPGQFVIADREAGSPCGQWNPCEHCREAMDRITVPQVAGAVRTTWYARKAA